MKLAAVMVVVMFVSACGTDGSGGPETDGEADALAGPLVLVDGQGEARSSIEVGENVLARADKLTPSGSAKLVVRDVATGAEVLSEQLAIDASGALPTTLVWPDVGLGHSKARPFSFTSLDIARQSLGGRAFVVELYDGKTLVAKNPLSISKDLTDPRISPCDSKGALMSGPTTDQELWVSLRNLTPKAVVDVVLVPEQVDWHEGDPIRAVVATNTTPLVRRVTLDAKGSASTVLAKANRAPIGRYQIAVLPAAGAYADRSFDAGTDRVSDRLVTTVGIRPGASDPTSLVRAVQLAGHATASVPGFEYGDSFEAGTGIMVAIDPDALGVNAGRKVRFYVIPHRTASAWVTDTSLVDVTGHVVEVVTRTDSIGANRVLLWANPSPGDYDVIADFGNAPDDPEAFVTDAHLDVTRGDLIDGYGRVGFHVGPDPSRPGSYAVGSTTFAGTPMVLADPGGPFTQDANASVRYPAGVDGADVAISPAHATYPLVVVMHGQGLPWNGYDYLLDQLATQGYVAAEIQCDAILGFAVDPATDYARCLLGTMSQLAAAPGPFHGHLDLTRVALVGHSRGGDGVVRAETLNRDEHLGWELRAVVSLSPTDGSGGTLETPLLCLFGSNDDDVGNESGFPFAVAGTGFRIYDRARADKALIFVRDADHNQFNRLANPEEAFYHPSQIILDRASQESLARGYVTAFLQWQLDGRTDQREYFAGHLAVASAAGVAIRRELEPPAAALRVVDDFSGASSAVNALGGTVTPAGLEKLVVDTAGNLDKSSPHSTRAALLRWTAPALYTTAIPAGARNVLPYAALSLRVGQTYGYTGSVSDHNGSSTWSQELDAGVVSAGLRAALASTVSLSASAHVTVVIAGAQWQLDDGGSERRWTVKRIHQGDGTTPTQFDILQLWRRGAARNHATFAQTFRIRLYSGDGRSREVDVGTSEAIAYPDRPTLDPLFWDVDDHRTLATMQTVRIPLSAFTLASPGADPVDLTNVTAISLELGYDSGTVRSGELLLDDLAFEL